MRLSPFNPVLFGEPPFADYPHVFSTTDYIMVECFVTPDEQLPTLTLAGEGIAYNLTWHRRAMGDTVAAFYVIRGLDAGSYTLSIGQLKSNAIVVTEDERILSKTVLIQYCRNDNLSRFDVATMFNRGRYFFDLRIEGGFKDNGWEFAVDNEQFCTDNSDIVELYAMDSTIKELTIGSSSGVPVWIGEIVNRALSCHALYIDGIRYTRSEASTPEAATSVEGDSRFVFKVKLQPWQNVSAVELKEDLFNRLALRRTPNDLRRTTNELRRV